MANAQYASNYGISCVRMPTSGQRQVRCPGYRALLIDFSHARFSDATDFFVRCAPVGQLAAAFNRVTPKWRDHFRMTSLVETYPLKPVRL